MNNFIFSRDMFHSVQNSLLFFLLISASKFGFAFSEEEERWLNSDQEAVAESVNEGELHFLTTTDKPVLYSINKLTITRKSIDTGWVKLEQCYRQLDKLPEVDITYQYRFMRSLKILSKKNIDNAKLHGQSITLTNIKNNAEVCVSADVRIFYQNPDKTFSLVNGPYHRKFLDGYYPYKVTLEIHYPDQQLAYIRSKPVPQAGFSIINHDGIVKINSLFEGRLNTEIVFREIKETSQ